ncbi:MAG: methylenetetrahydrofolate reductase [Lachnospiraceae bacterium]|nr:methylenetetrahydrofolate reductase [Lachnospiraceae bacterium]
MNNEKKPTIPEIMKHRMTLSFEVFPPKQDKPLDPLMEVLDKLYTVEPDFISCTYGAGGTNVGRHMEICKSIAESGKTIPISHFTCIGSHREDIKKQMDTCLSLGINHILVLRGDIPEGWEGTRGDFQHASELIGFLREEYGDKFVLSMAAAPEKHIEAATFAEDIAHLKMKQDSGADFITTQLCYDVQGFERWLDKIRKAGIYIPVDVGIMPVLNKNSVIKMCLGTNGCSIPQPLAEMISKHYNDDPEDFRKAGIEYTVKMVYEYMALGVQGLHFYSLNKADAVLEICKDCGLIYRK